MGICLLVIARGEELNIQHFFDWKTLSYTYNIVEFPSVNDKLCGDKNLNNSVFFLSILKYACQFVSAIEFICTLCWMALPRFFLANDFKLTCLYVLNTTSIL